MAEGNKIEIRFGLRLFSELGRGEIIWYGYEPIKLKLGKGAWFTPDFGVLEKDGSFTFYEVKGTFFREAAKVRLKVARERYPFFRFVVVREDKHGWQHTDL